MLLWLNFSRVAILNPKQSRRICSVVKQHFLNAWKSHESAVTQYSHKQNEEKPINMPDNARVSLWTALKWTKDSRKLSPLLKL